VKFLIDECLSPARARGYGESSHVVWLGLGGWKDWQLKVFILDGDWTFVTRNAIDFRGPVNNPGSKGQYAGVPLHAGLICLDASVGMDLNMQVELFDQALDELALDNDLVNQVLEVTMENEETLHIRRYDLPPASD
jgi:hypothetical protein